MGFEHAVESVRQLVSLCGSDQGLLFEFALREQMLVESAQGRAMLHRHQGST